MILLRRELVSNSELRLSRTLLYLKATLALVEKRPPIATIANGNPPHPSTMPQEKSTKSRGHCPLHIGTPSYRRVQRLFQMVEMATCTDNNLKIHCWKEQHPHFEL